MAWKNTIHLEKNFKISKFFHSNKHRKKISTVEVDSGNIFPEKYFQLDRRKYFSGNFLRPVGHSPLSRPPLPSVSRESFFLASWFRPTFLASWFRPTSRAPGMWSLSSLLHSVLPCHAAERCGSPRPLHSSATIATRPYTYSFSPSIAPAIVGRARCLYVNATRKKEGARMRTHYVDVELGNDDDDGFDDFDEEGENEDVGGSDDGELLPFDKMRSWLEKRPWGFGEGKRYETSLEGQLLQEIEQSRKAQEANLNNLKRNKSKSESMKQPLKQQQDGSLNYILGRLSSLVKWRNKFHVML
ncbi:uncharacterized protein LOC116256795 [Nymphaea colorata]|nr:uncharacterized protein LOC116256795 [Nymphaea colorata]